MQALFQAISAAHRRGEDFALCTIIENFGSAPRGSGAMLAVFGDGTVSGTVGGGAVEHETIQLAQRALKEGHSITQRFVLSPNDAADIGMICGGNVTVRIAPVLGSDRRFSALLDALIPQLSRRTDSWLVDNIDGGFDLYMDGEGLCLGGDAEAAAIRPLLGPQPVLLKTDNGEPQRFLLPLTHAQTVYVFGGGHVAFELVPLLSRVGFSTVVFEDRPDFCTTERFPAAHGTVLGDFSDIGKHIDVTPADLLVIMTRGHQADYAVLRQALQTDACYIGLIGSRRKIAATHERLRADGFAEANLVRIHAPIGLAIRAETPAEIAVSIAAELILHRAQWADGQRA